MKYTESLNKNYEFRRLYSKGKSAGTRLLVIYTLRNRSGLNRLGLTVGGKVGGAVVRNRVRRKIREIYRLNESKLRRSRDIVIVARADSRDASYQELEKAFFSACSKAELLLAEEK